MGRRLEDTLKRNRAVIEPAADVLIWVIALTFVTALRYDLDGRRSLTVKLSEVCLVAALAQVLAGKVTSLYGVRWKNASFEQIIALTTAVSMATFVLILFNILALRHAIPTRSVVAAGAYTLAGYAGVRAAWRLLWEFRAEGLSRPSRAIVFGAGEGGAQVIDALRSPSSPFVAVGLLDDAPSMRNTQIRHLRVSGGREQLGALAKQLAADTVILAIPSATSGLVRLFSDMATALDLEIRVLPPTAELLQRPGVTMSEIRTVTEADLLGRHVIQTDVETIADYITQRRVLVTGAGGSIGSELCRQILRFAPATLVMLDRDESALQELQLSIEGQALLDTRRLAVCDIRDPDALRGVFEEHCPEVVFHAAALKHLPLLEMWPAEAAKTNVFGTFNVLSSCVSLGIERFVNISTDKAADPSSVLGFTKRIAERLTASVIPPPNAAYLSVRFGNVLGSRGSVLSTFRAQIEAGGPVTVTHPDVTRYFMTVQEAVQLVVQAGAIGSTGEVLVLDMGSPARIAEVAKRLVEVAGGPIEIVYTGLRPGEKLHEVLFADGESDVRPTHDLISHVPAPPLDADLLHRIDLSADPVTLGRELRALAASPAPNTEEWSMTGVGISTGSDVGAS